MTPKTSFKPPFHLVDRWTSALAAPVLGVLLTLLGLSPTQSELQAADVTALQASAYRNSIAQDSVGRQVEEIREQLGLLLQDFYQNEVDSDEARAAMEIAEILDSLNAEQIRPLVATLKDAGNRQELEAILHSLAESSQTQKRIQVDLKALETRLDDQISQATLSRRFNALVLRQAANLRHTADVLQMGKTKKARSAVALLQSEQVSLRDELSLALGRLSETPANPTQAALYASVHALAQSHQLTKQAEAAATFAGDQAINDSLSAQQRVLTGLRAIAGALQSEQSPKERLLAMQSTLDRLANEQSQLAEELKAADKGELDAIRERQAALLDEANVLRGDLSAINGRAGKQLDEAARSMDEAAEALADMKKVNPRQKAPVAKTQEAAAEQLNAARETLDQQLAAMNTQTAPDTKALDEKIAQLRSMEDEVSEIAEQQAAMGEAPTRQQQQPLANQTADLQNKAEPVNQEAAKALNDAFLDMQLQKTKEAQEALQQAKAALQEEIETLERRRDADQELANLAALKDAVEQTAAQQAALGDEPLPEAQQALGSQTADLQAQAEAANQPAADQLSDALAHMQAQEPQAAKESLEQAAEGLEKAMAELEERRALEAALAGLKSLQEEILETARQQRELDRNASPERQAALAEEVARLQEAAFPLSPPAAKELGAALTQMPTAPAQAAQSMEQAARSLSEQMQELAQLQQQLEQMQQLATSVEAAEAQARDAAQQLAEQAATGGDLAAPAQQLENVLNQLREPYQMAEAAGLEDTAAALKQAGQNLKQASQSAKQNQASEATERSETAQTALEQALDSLEQAMAAAQQQAESAAPSMAQSSNTPPSGSNQPSSKSSKGGEKEGGSGPDNFLESNPADLLLGQANEGLRPEQREAAMLLNKQSAPVEYQSLVQTYLRNLAEGVSPGESSP